MAGFTKPKPESPLVVQRRFQRASNILGYQAGELVTEKDVRSRFAELAKAYHPDTSKSGEVEVMSMGYTLDQLRKAKDELLKQLGDLK